MTTPPSFNASIARDWPPALWRDVTVLVAISGGADSVALLRAIAALGEGGSGRIVAAHFNHRLRGAESDADEAFVVELCQRFGIECHTGCAARDATDRAASEESSRHARYEFLIAAARQFGARYVATAHTADDQAETVLHHVLRGTGLTGLSGIPRARQLADCLALVRPMLGLRRAQAREYLAELGQSFREDSSNADRGYTRNWLRMELLPLIAERYGPNVHDALVRLATLTSEAQEIIDAGVRPLADRALTSADDNRIVVDCSALADAPRYLLREMLMAAWRGRGWPMGAMGYDEWERLAAMAKNNVEHRAARKQVFPGSIVAERNGSQLTLSYARE